MPLLERVALEAAPRPSRPAPPGGGRSEWSGFGRGAGAGQNDFDRAEPLLRGALETRRSLLGRESDATAEALDRLATSYQRQNRYADAEPLFREALAIRRGLFGDTAVAVATSFNNLGVLLFEKGAYRRGRGGVPRGARHRPRAPG